MNYAEIVDKLKRAIVKYEREYKGTTSFNTDSIRQILFSNFSDEEKINKVKEKQNWLKMHIGTGFPYLDEILKESE